MYRSIIEPYSFHKIIGDQCCAVLLCAALLRCAVAIRSLSNTEWYMMPGCMVNGTGLDASYHQWFYALVYQYRLFPCSLLNTCAVITSPHYTAVAPGCCVLAGLGLLHCPSNRLLVLLTGIACASSLLSPKPPYHNGKAFVCQPAANHQECVAVCYHL